MKEETALLSGQKRKREDHNQKVPEGTAAARAFLDEFASLPLDGVAPHEAVAKAQELHKKLEDSARESPYLASLLVNAS